MKVSNDDIKNFISEYVEKLFQLYLKMDNSLVVNDKKVNLKQEKIKRVSLDNDDVQFYFDFFNAISEYRERLKQSIAANNMLFVHGEGKNGLFVESRIKNINSISSKIYQYISIKNEKGDVSINKCLNDLFGMRIVVPVKKFSILADMIRQISEEHGWKCRITDASKQEYKAVHMYLMSDNYSLRWEVQFWLAKDDSSNRDSHLKYKQAYTSWESTYSSSDLYKVCE